MGQRATSSSAARARQEQMWLHAPLQTSNNPSPCPQAAATAHYSSAQTQRLQPLHGAAGAQAALKQHPSHHDARAGIDVIVTVVAQRGRQPHRLLLPAPVAVEARKGRWAAAVEVAAAAGRVGPVAYNRTHTCHPPPGARRGQPLGAQRGMTAAHRGGSQNPKRPPQAGNSVWPLTHPWNSSVCAAAPVCRRLPPRASRLVAARRNILMDALVIAGLAQLQKAGIARSHQALMAPAELSAC